MTVKVVYSNGNTGEFGPVSSAPALDGLITVLAARPDVRSVVATH